MRIRVDEIPDSGRFLHLHWDEERLSHFQPPEDPFRIKLLEPVNVDLEIQKLPDHLRITGDIQGTLRVACHRCLEEFSWELREEVDLHLLVEKPEAEEDEEEPEFEEEDLDIEFFDGEVIDVDRLVAEQIFLALPYKLLCSDACKGLCPRCGANLNTETCTCAKDTGGGTFAALGALKERLPRSRRGR